MADERAQAVAEEALPERSRKVAAVLAAAGHPVSVRVLSSDARTAALAAEALGCPVGAIANSLVFSAAGTPVLVLTSGAHRVATKALAGRLGLPSLDRADPALVRAATGQAIGGVAPVGHPAPLLTVVDPALGAYDRVWAAAGTPNTVFATTRADLLALTGGRDLPVAD
ncbi:YbaK/EbsC family protein [Nocardiopsis coralliicola]